MKDRAVEQGCQRETIELDEWYNKLDIDTLAGLVQYAIRAGIARG